MGKKKKLNREMRKNASLFLQKIRGRKWKVTEIKKSTYLLGFSYFSEGQNRPHPSEYFANRDEKLIFGEKFGYLIDAGFSVGVN